MADDKAEVNFIDNPHAPEIFSHGYSGLWRNGGLLHITFEAPRIDHGSNPGPINRVVVGRLVIPIEAAMHLADNIKGFLSNPEVAPPLPPGSGLH
ncbi:hypothetical protein CY658_04990 [Variovorax sp. RO1]|uniref:hypothetical protein n=1 Tax=Variovorax sp. RO1 TaxID=2066034 RepID=UPI000C717015|nr:hypothetical protein [Variovorax sp. RO1]PLC06393.1 hypothetical protein CY658_04990 [Variovorax sp. RO1]